MDNINRLRDLIRMYGNLRRDVGSFSGSTTQNGRAALRKASREAGEVYEEIERILFLLREARPPVPPRPTLNPADSPEFPRNDPGQRETHACATCGVFVEYMPAKFAGDPDQGWRHKGMPASDVRPHIVVPQSL